MAATHNNLRAATAALSAMAIILLAVTLLALRPIPAFAEENQAQEAAAGNISLSVPTELNCFVKADGQVITPEAKDYAIANTGTEEVMLDAVTVTANSDSGPISLSAEAFVGTTGQPAGTLSSWFSYSKDANGLGDVKSQEKQILQPGQSLLAKWNVGKLNAKDNANVLNRLSGKDGFALAAVSFTFKPKQAFAVLYDDGSAVLYKRCVKQMPVAGNGFNDGTGMRKVSKVVSSIENNEDIFKNDTLINRVTVRDSGIKPRTTKQWFLNCVNLTNAELKQLDTSLTSSMESMFNGCTELLSIDVSGWDTRNVTNMRLVFTYCEKITELDLSSWDTGNVTDMYSLFYDCQKLRTISFPEDGAGNKWITGKVTDMAQMFSSCYDLNPVDVSSWDTGSVTDMRNMFSDCKKFDKLDLSRWDTGSVTNMALMFAECSNLKSITFPKGNDLKKWDMRNVTSMESMFNGCTELLSIDVSGWDTRNVTNMRLVFTYCEKITELDLSSWDTGNVTDMYSLFYDCQKLRTISFPEDGAGNKWITGKVTDMAQMFSSCYDLNPVDVSSWDTGSVTDMRNMFSDCKKFDKLDLSRWDTGSVTNMALMFADCSNLKSLDLSGFHISNDTSVDSMFADCNLTSVTLTGSKWSRRGINELTYFNLVSENGTSLAYDSIKYFEDPVTFKTSWATSAFSQIEKDAECCNSKTSEPAEVNSFADSMASCNTVAASPATIVRTESTEVNTVQPDMNAGNSSLTEGAVGQITESEDNLPSGGFDASNHKVQKQQIAQHPDITVSMQLCA